MARIISYVDIIEIMTDIARRHYQVNTFFLGKNYELGNSGDIIYPVLQVYPEFARMPINDYKEYKTLEFTLNCKVIDLTTNDDGNLKDVYSDTLRIAQDIVNELNQHPFYVHSNVSLISDIQFNELDQFEDDITAGWGFSLNLRVINANTFCGMPIAELPGYSASGPTSDGDYVNVDWRGPTGPAGANGATGSTGPTLGLSASLAITNDTHGHNIVITNGDSIISENNIGYIQLTDDGVGGSNYNSTILTNINNYDIVVGDSIFPTTSQIDIISNESDGFLITPTGKITLQAGTISAMGNVQLNNLSNDRITYIDNNNILNTATIGTGLTFSSGVLSTTATIPVISTTTVISTATSSVIDVSTPNTYYSVTSLSTSITFTTSGTYSNFDKMVVRIKDNGATQSLTFNPTYYEAKGQALPTTTVISKVLTIGFIYDSVTTKFGCVSVAQEI